MRVYFAGRQSTYDPEEDFRISLLMSFDTIGGFPDYRRRFLRNKRERDE